MSRTNAHLPYWVARNRAAAEDPHNNIDHDHRAGMPIYRRQVVTEEYTAYERVAYDSIYWYTDSVGVAHYYPLTYDREVTKTRTYWKRVNTGERTTGACDFEPLHANSVRHYRNCEPDWVRPGHRSYWYGGWAKSYADEKREYWSGVRTEVRGKTTKWAKMYNAGEDLTDTDDCDFKYADDHSFPFWW